MIVDFIFGLIFIIGLIKGYQKGLIKQVISLMSLFITVIIASIINPFVKEILISKELLKSDTFSWIFFLISILIGYILILLFSKVITEILKILRINFTNKFGGAIFGALKYSIIVLFFLFFLKAVNIVDRTNASESMINFIDYSSLLFRRVVIHENV